MNIRNIMRAKDMLEKLIIEYAHNCGDKSIVNFLNMLDLDNEKYFIAEIEQVKFMEGYRTPFKEGGHILIYETMPLVEGTLVVGKDNMIRQYYKDEIKFHSLNIENSYKFEPEYDLTNIFGIILMVLPSDMSSDICDLRLK